MAGDERLKQKRNYLSRVHSRASRLLLSRGTDAVSRPVASPYKADVPDAEVFIPFSIIRVKTCIGSANI